MDNWQPIDTAPKDGTWILIYKEYTAIEWYDVVLWREDDYGNGTWVEVGDLNESCADPSHWAPLHHPSTVKTDDEVIKRFLVGRIDEALTKPCAQPDPKWPEAPGYVVLTVSDAKAIRSYLVDDHD
jgi:hypothetical protein